MGILPDDQAMHINYDGVCVLITKLPRLRLNTVLVSLLPARYMDMLVLSNRSIYVSCYFIVFDESNLLQGISNGEPHTSFVRVSNLRSVHKLAKGYPLITASKQ